MVRGAVRKSDSDFVGVWFPRELVVAVEDAVQSQDTDRSKFIRTAVRERLQREGLLRDRPRK
jgi:metal-responsive CopG/Arc/MetJ family transcriptional regulator